LFQVAAFLLGWFALVVALISPIHEMSESLFSAHMAQHELLMAVAAPLLVVGRPDLMYLWALPMSWRKWLGKLRHNVVIAWIWRLAAVPFSAWLLHGIALWMWHIPALFNETLFHSWIHAAQHASFLGTALLFWGSLLYGHMGKRAYGTGILYVFTTAIHTSILGALLTFASSPWYAIYQRTTAFWGLSPLEDQQLGGLIMWVPASLIYVVVGLWLFAGWIRDSDRRTSFGRVQAIIQQ
jgi:cytochrome c oxidase assembly factor CtaG